MPLVSPLINYRWHREAGAGTGLNSAALIFGKGRRFGRLADRGRFVFYFRVGCSHKEPPTCKAIKSPCFTCGNVWESVCFLFDPFLLT